MTYYYLFVIEKGCIIKLNEKDIMPYDRDPTLE